MFKMNLWQSEKETLIFSTKLAKANHYPYICATLFEINSLKTIRNCPKIKTLTKFFALPMF